MSDLKSCPFCGGERFKAYSTWVPSEADYWFAVCEDCGARGPEVACKSRDPKDEWESRAFDAWNTRAERTCKQIYPNDSDFRKNPVARCSECMRPLVKYESGELANFCHFCGARVVEQCAT